MRRVSLAAGLYNLVWGAFGVLFPGGAIFRWMEMTQPKCPQFWQCMGMIVGVCGLGYLIAAFDPARHWPMLRWGKLAQLLGRSVWVRGTLAFFAGHRVGPLEGDGTQQMRGVFLICDGRVVHRFLPATAADRPDNVELCRILATA